METTRTFIYGASGHGKVILDILTSQKEKITGFIDDDVLKTEFEELPVFRKYILQKETDRLILGIGSNQARMKIENENPGLSYISAIHPTAVISQKATLKTGIVVMHGAIIQSCAQIGSHCIINTGASVDHDCIIEDFVHISPGAVLCGEVKIGSLTWVGANAVIIQGIKVGSGVIIGAGSVIINDVPDNVTIVGNPGRITRIRG